MADDIIDMLDLTAFTGTVLALEQSRIHAGEPWCTSAVAGLQFYAYGRDDELIGRVLPVAGDVITLMRRPENHRDPNAVEVWWRNAYHLGHLPRRVAEDLAPRLDVGISCRAYVHDGGSGTAWSMRLLLVGAAVAPLHAERIERAILERQEAVRLEVAEASGQVWPVQPDAWEVPESERRGGRWQSVNIEPRVPPSDRQRRAATAWGARRDAARDQRRRDALHALSQLPEPCPGSDLVVDESLRGIDIPRWENVPSWLRTRKQLADLGFKPAPGSKAFAWKTGDYGPYPMFLARDAVPVRARVRAARPAGSREIPAF